MALPHKPIINMDAPIFVNLPKPSNANGHIPAQTSELAKPNNTTNHIDRSAVWPKKVTWPLEKTISNVNVAPIIVHIRNEVPCVINLGITKMPITQPQIAKKSVYAGKTLASNKDIFIELAYPIIVSTDITCVPTCKKIANAPNIKCGN